MAIAAGLPLWWVLGLAELVFFLAALPMAVHLLVSRPLRVPSWFGLWLAFLAVVLFSGPLMAVTAPGTLDATLGTASLTFLFRFAIYVVATVFMLYVVNLSESQLPTRVVAEVLAGIFVVTVAGGVFGILAPGFELTSLMERILPTALREVSFVQILIHPSASDVTDILGFEQPRPKAPYAYANTWGAIFTVTLPFFLWRSFGASASWWRRLAALPVLAGAAVAVIYSLNRGLWLGIALAAAVYALHEVRRRGLRVVPVLVVAATVLALGVAVSPLGTLIAQRLDSPHSNSRRSDMAVVTTQAVLEASPVLGFGNTRKLQGSFFSIAGDATPNCPLCAVPPLGTQGHAWLVLFAQGLLGAVLFFGFLLAGLATNLRRRDPVAVASVAALLPLTFETAVYDTLGSPFILALLVFGLMARSAPTPRVVPLERLTTSLRAGWTRVAVGAAVGLAVGLAILPTRPPTYEATAEVLFPPNPTYLPASSSRVPRPVTVDTESRTALAAPLLAEVRAETGVDDVEFGVSAVPGSRVLVLSATGSDARAAQRAADGLAEAVVEAQRERLRALRTDLVEGTEARLRSLGQTRRRASEGTREVYAGLVSLRKLDRDRIARTLLVRATQLRPAQVARVDSRNRLVPPLSGLALGVTLGGLLAVLRPRPLGRGALRRLAPGVLTLGPEDRHNGPLVPAILRDRHGPDARVRVLTVDAQPRDVEWMARTLERGGLVADVDPSRGRGAATRAAGSLEHDAVVLVVGPRPPEAEVARTLETLASVGSYPDVIMVGATRLVAGPRARWTAV